MKIPFTFFVLFATQIIPLKAATYGRKNGLVSGRLRPQLKLWRNPFGSSKAEPENQESITGTFRVQGTATLKNGKIELDISLANEIAPETGLMPTAASTTPTASTQLASETTANPTTGTAIKTTASGPTSATGTTTPAGGSTRAGGTTTPAGGSTAASGTPPLVGGSTSTSGTTPPAGGSTLAGRTTTPAGGSTSASGTPPPVVGSTSTSGTPPAAGGSTSSSGTPPPARGSTSASGTPTPSPTPGQPTSASSVPTSSSTAPTAGTSGPTAGTSVATTATGTTGAGVAASSTGPTTSIPSTAASGSSTLPASKPTSPVMTTAASSVTPPAVVTSKPTVPVKICISPGQVYVIIVAKGVMAAHNSFRRTHGSPALQLDKQMTCDAQNFAQRMASRGVLEHQSSSILARKRVGENIGMSCTPARNGPLSFQKIKRMVGNVAKRWYDEVCEYNFDKPNFAPRVGHFTEVVWSDSRKLGVGYAVGKNAKFPGYVCVYVVGRYQPAGNNMGSQRLETNVKRGNFNDAYCTTRSKAPAFTLIPVDKRNQL